MPDISKPLQSLGRSRQIDDCCDAFEAAWKTGQQPSLAAQLQSTPAEDQAAWLRELIPIDLFHRCKRGDQPKLEEYLAQFPNLNAPWLAVVFAEMNKFPVRTIGPQFEATVAPTYHVSLSRPEPASPESDVLLVPGYELIGELGRGAMGVVYKAQQLGLGRTVALKMIRSRGDASPEELARFKSEGAAIALITHPNIVQIYDFGEFQGRPYFSLEYIDGGTLAQKIAGVPQPPREAARTIETLARAIHQAHQAGIVHRDLKPANVLMTRYGVPKITDFGLAKQTEADHSATATGMLLGTPQYMAPEQASGNSAEVGAAADIYALGVILYEMLTGRPPFQAANLSELLHAINTQDPAAPTRLKHDTPRDLETICLKCLHKHVASRYESAAALADDLLLFLEERPIRARPISRFERLKLWCRRNPQVAIPSAALLSLLVLVSLVSLVAAVSFRRISEQASKSAREASHATKLADSRAQDAQFELARSQINEARMRRRSQRVGQQTQALVKLDEAKKNLQSLLAKGYTIPQETWLELSNEAASALLVPDITETRRWPREQSALAWVATDHEHGRYINFAGSARQIELRQIGTGQILETIPAPENCHFTQGSFSEAGDHLLLHSQPDAQLHFWEVKRSPRFLHRRPLPTHWRVMSRDGSVYVSGDAQTKLQVTRVADGQVICESQLALPVFGYPLHPTQPWVVLGAGSELFLFDYAAKQLRWQRTVPDGLLNASWSEDGRWVAVAGPKSVQSFSAATGEPLFDAVTSFDSEGVFPIPVSQAGMLGAQDWSRSLRLLHPLTGRPQLKTTAGFFDWPRAYGSSGQLTLGYDGADYLVRQARGGYLREFALHGTDYVTLSHSGYLLVTHRAGRPAGLYHLPSGEHLRDVPAQFGDVPLGFEPDDRALLLYGKDWLRRLPLQFSEDQTQLTLGPEQPILPSPARDRWGLDQAGKTVVVPDYGNGGDIYQLSSTGSEPRLSHTPPQNDVRSATVSPDGRWAVFGSHVDGKVCVYSTEDARLVKELASGGGSGRFSPNGQYLAISNFAGGSELFEVARWKSRGRLPGQWAAFSHDGKLLAVESGIGTIALVETRTLRQLAQLEIQELVRLNPLAFTPDNSGLVLCTLEDRRLLYLDLAGLRRDLKQRGLDFELPTTIPDWPPTKPIPTVQFAAEQPANRSLGPDLKEIIAKEKLPPADTLLRKQTEAEPAAAQSDP